MRLLGLALVVCVVAVAAAAPNKGATTKAAAGCKASADCKKMVCGKSTSPSCDKAAKKCVCKAKSSKTKKPTTTTTTAGPEQAKEDEAASGSPAEDTTGAAEARTPVEAESKAPQDAVPSEEPVAPA